MQNQKLCLFEWCCQMATFVALPSCFQPQKLLSAEEDRLFEEQLTKVEIAYSKLTVSFMSGP